MILPQQYAIYKGMGGKFGAAQFNLQLPHKFCAKCKKRDYTGNSLKCSECTEDLSVREGAVFLEVTSAKDKNVYDWSKKVTIALSVTDLSKLLYGIRTASEGSEVKLLHDPGAKTETMGKVQKHLTLSSPKGPSAGFMLSVAQIGGQDKLQHTVPLSAEEALTIATLFQAAIARTLAWSA
jgi:hypothetical protein